MARNGSSTQRIGKRFLDEADKIKLKRIELKKDDALKPISLIKITNLIVRHSAWEEISKKIIEATDKEVSQYGLE